MCACYYAHMKNRHTVRSQRRRASTWAQPASQAPTFCSHAMKTTGTHSFSWASYSLVADYNCVSTLDSDNDIG